MEFTNTHQVHSKGDGYPETTMKPDSTQQVYADSIVTKTGVGFSRVMLPSRATLGCIDNGPVQLTTQSSGLCDLRGDCQSASSGSTLDSWTCDLWVLYLLWSETELNHSHLVLSQLLTHAQ